MLKIVLPLMFLATAVQAVPLHARTTTATARIAYGDLNLASKSGQQALDRRINRAIDQVCGIAVGTAKIYLNQTEAECRDAKQAEIQPLREAAISQARQEMAALERTAL